MRFWKKKKKTFWNRLKDEKENIDTEQTQFHPRFHHPTTQDESFQNLELIFL